MAPCSSTYHTSRTVGSQGRDVEKIIGPGARRPEGRLAGELWKAVAAQLKVCPFKTVDSDWKRALLPRELFEVLPYRIHGAAVFSYTFHLSLDKIAPHRSLIAWPETHEHRHRSP